MTERKTAAGAYAKIQAHEDLCAERYHNIHTTLGDIKGEQKTIRNAAWALLMAMIGWLAVQVYDSVKPKAPAATAVVVSQSPPQSEPVASR